MNFSIASLITRLFGKPPELVIDKYLWACLIDGLRERGRGRRESGAFLLGSKSDIRHVRSIVFYDEIDPAAFDTGIVVIDGACMADLWRICRERGQAVVADIHTHPGGAWQSESDRMHPMIAEPGHVALIMPRFAQAPVILKQIGFYRYLGQFNWLTRKSSFLRPTLKIGSKAS